MGILRGIESSQLPPLLEAAIAAGLETLEIAMNTARAPELIARARSLAGERLSIGAGTVLGRDDLEAALDAGAGFVVSPTLVDEVVAECVERKLPVFPGALTPGEVHAAWRAGASMVKVFPASCFGPAYFRELKGPFADIPLLACGGVTAQSLPEYARHGADAFAFGASVFARDSIQSGDYAQIEVKIRALIAALPDSQS